MSRERLPPSTPATRRAFPWLFCLLVLALSVPFYVLGAAHGRLPFADFLPFSAFMALTPMIAALMLTYRAGGLEGIRDLLSGVFDSRKIASAGWLLVTLVLIPFIVAVAYGVHWLNGGLPLAAANTFGQISVFFVIFFVGAIGEEVGWQGYAFPRLSEKRGVFVASLLLGTIWALWHVIPYAQMGRSGDWIFWHCLGTVALRVILVWLFVNNRNSIFVAVLFHTTINMVWGIFPNYAAVYDPAVTFAILAVTAGTIVVLSGPSRLRA